MNLDLHKIQPALDEELGEIDAEGVLCAVNIDGEIQTYSAGNISKEEHGLSFYIYSISKSFTAAGILLLQEQGKLSLEDEVASMFPQYNLPRRATVRQLLNHTSGLSDYFSSRDYQEAVHANPSDPWTYEKLMEVGLRQTPLYEPGAGWMYSNPAYAILMELIEKVSGQNYYAFVEETILDPLGLSETVPFARLDHGVELLAGEDPAMKQDFRKVYHPGWISTGSFISTVADVTRFYQGLFSEKLSLSLEEMTKTVEVPFSIPEPRIPLSGLGLMSFGNDPHGENYGHGGGGPGYSNYAKHCLSFHGKKVTVATVVNASLPHTPFDLTHRVFDCLEA